jgi:hypothetical protein
MTGRSMIPFNGKMKIKGLGMKGEDVSGNMYVLGSTR